MDNVPPFASEELTEFLMHHCIEHSTSSPNFPRSNGFIEWQVRTIKTAFNTALPSKKPLEAILLDLWLTPIGPSMPLPLEILHNRIFQCPIKPLQPVDMEMIRHFLLSSCIIFFYQLTTIQVTTLLNTIVEAWVIIEILQGYSIRKFLHFLRSLHQILDLSNPHEYALSVTNIVYYNFLLKLYK